MQKLKEIKDLLRAAQIKDLYESFNKTIAEKPNIDKFGLMFGGDNRFSVFACSVFLDCHTGYYGNSSCSTYFNVDSKLAQEALNHYLNDNLDEVLAGMGEYLENKAAKLVGQAEKELAEQQAILDAIKKSDTQD